MWIETLTNEFFEAGISWHSTTSEKDFEKKLRKAVADGAKEVWIGGGDGTVRQAAGILANTGITLGILPLGTGNNLANELGIPCDPKRMISFLLEGTEPRAIDIGMFGEQAFVNVATVGMTSRIAYFLKMMDKSKAGRLVYIPAAIASVALTRRFKVKITSDGFTFSGKAVQVVFASSERHAGPVKVTPDAELSDGHLAVYVVTAQNRAESLKYGAKLLLGTHTDLPFVENGKLNQGEIVLDHPRHFVLDGDLVKCSGAKVRVLPGGLVVLAAPVEESLR